MGVNVHPGPLPALILTPARAEKEARSHTEISPPVQTNNCQHNTVLITGRGDVSQSNRLFIIVIALSC